MRTETKLPWNNCVKYLSVKLSFCDSAAKAVMQSLVNNTMQSKHVSHKSLLNNHCSIPLQHVRHCIKTFYVGEESNVSVQKSQRLPVHNIHL